MRSGRGGLHSSRKGGAHHTHRALGEGLLCICMGELVLECIGEWVGLISSGRDTRSKEFIDRE